MWWKNLPGLALTARSPYVQRRVDLFALEINDRQADQGRNMVRRQFDRLLDFLDAAVRILHIQERAEAEVHVGL